MDALGHLGVRQTTRGGELRVWSENATAVQLCIFAADDPSWVAETHDLQRNRFGVWRTTTRSLQPGTRYALRVDGPHGAGHAFDPDRLLVVVAGPREPDLRIDEELDAAILLDAALALPAD